MSRIIFLLLFGYGWASLLPNGCPADFSVQLMLPHETDCSRFYTCSNGQRILMQCPGGLFFQEELQMCDWPPTTSTTFKTTPSETTTTTTTIKPTTTTMLINTTTPITIPTTPTISPTTPSSTTSTTPATTITTTTIRPIPPIDCPEEWQVMLKLSEDSDCVKYLHCSDSVKLLLKCPKKKRNNFEMVFTANYSKTFDIEDL